MTPFLLVFLPPALLAVSTALGGWALLLPPVVLFGVIPLLDHLVPQDRAEAVPPRWFGLLPVLFLPAHFATAAWALAVAAQAPPLQAAALTAGCGFSAAMAINVAHELMHRAGRVQPSLATVLLSSTLYTHFSVEHVQGHHKRVGTPDDPATSRLGESIVRFLPRTLLGSLRSAWRIEAERVGWCPANRVLQGFAVQGVVLVGVGAWLGPLGLGLFLAQAAVGVLMLETINYIEHYGLVREARADGGFVRVRPEHSWNSSHRVSNWILLNLARHSDHHAFAARSFGELRHHDGAPQLPTGYAGMLLLAWVPPVWFRVMDPRVAAAMGRARRVDPGARVGVFGAGQTSEVGRDEVSPGSCRAG